MTEVDDSGYGCNNLVGQVANVSYVSFQRWGSRWLLGILIPRGHSKHSADHGSKDPDEPQLFILISILGIRFRLIDGSRRSAGLDRANVVFSNNNIVEPNFTDVIPRCFGDV